MSLILRLEECFSFYLHRFYGDVQHRLQYVVRQQLLGVRHDIIYVNTLTENIANLCITQSQILEWNSNIWIYCVRNLYRAVIKS